MTSIQRNFIHPPFLFILLLLIFSSYSNTAGAFPFLYLQPGDRLPRLDFIDMHTAEKHILPVEGNSPQVFIFWGAEIIEQKQRTIKVLSQFQEALPFFEERNIKVLGIDIQNNPREIRTEIIYNAGATFPQYTDPENHAFDTFGAYVLPAVLFVNHRGEIAVGMGYDRRLMEFLTGEIQIVLKEKSRQQIHQELYPEVFEKDPAREKAETRYNYGRNLIDRGMKDAAVNVFKQAIEADPHFGPPYIELGCLYTEIRDINEAKVMLDRGLDLVPESARGRKCSVKLLLEEVTP